MFRDEPGISRCRLDDFSILDFAPGDRKCETRECIHTNFGRSYFVFFERAYLERSSERTYPVSSSSRLYAGAWLLN